MGMGNYPNYADTISIDFVKEICNQEYLALDDALGDADLLFDDFCYYKHIEQELETDTEKQRENIDKAWDRLKAAFDKETGLELHIVFANAEDRGDELDGGSFAVEGVYQLSPAGKKYKDKIERKAWNNFG